MSISVKLSPRPRRHKQKEDTKQQEMVAQVHKQIMPTHTSSDNDHVTSEDNVDVPKSDKNENYSVVHTPSREISVDGDVQINSKILSLIETEMKRDINKHNHFTESRPQSLSFYEDEKLPEELSGNLELLSPEEKKHIKKRRDLYSQMDTEERNAYNVIQDLYGAREAEEILGPSAVKKTKKKKKYAEAENGIGDSREMMIPKEKKKTKKKKRDGSPTTSSYSKRKHKTKNREDDYQLKNDITLALEELQDDVFENAPEEPSFKMDKARKSPRKSDKVYVQKKNKFEAVPRQNGNHLSRQAAQDLDESVGEKRFSSQYPIQIATKHQRRWTRVSNLCHGLLGGLALGHCLYITCNFSKQDRSFLLHYAYYSDIYVALFFALCVFCLVSVFDRLDVGHIQWVDLGEFVSGRKSSVVVVIYAACLIIHLSATPYDEKLSLMSYGNRSTTTLLNETQITPAELNTWNHLSLWRAALAFVAWIIVGLSPSEDMLYSHLKGMEQYLPHMSNY
ncbi:uncharacterized protein LOC132705668 [Cylas formicarius]|uniref:uncharacterized protein LOC132705668 n=1 Tax=Cylas formicarius TaxID=197179 RepID=UPI00295872A0|nr:uncharacterized protein LOC132705668 [Cylas formicarius]